MPPYTLIDRLLKRELGGNRSKYTSFTGFYGDRKWIADLDIVNELEGHSGCVNALSWSKSGRLLASGSDDTNLSIHTYQPDNDCNPFNFTTTIATGHTANIFSVKFMPHSNDRTLVTCAGDSEIRIFDLEHSARSYVGSGTAAARDAEITRNGTRFMSHGDTNTRVYRSHSDRVKRIVTESSPHLFLSCSEDGEVRQWDLRQPSSYYPRPRQGLGGWSSDSSDSGVPPPLISYRRHHIDLNTISCSPSQPHYIVLGGAHLHAFLHDRRMMGRDLFDERGALPASEQIREATQCVRRFAPRGQARMSSRSNGHITACKISDAHPNTMIASWSGDWIYSFDLVQHPDVGDEYSEDDVEEEPFGSDDDVDTPQVEGLKRRRQLASSSATSEAAAARASSRQRFSQEADDDDQFLAVNYGNGQSELIPLRDTPETTEARSKAHSIAEAVTKLTKFIFQIRIGSLPESDQHNTGYDFSPALEAATACIDDIDEIIRTWTYPVQPRDPAVAWHTEARRVRDATRRFVQCAGMLARLFGAQFPKDSHPRTINKFVGISAAPNESRPQSLDEHHALFCLDLVKAISLWLSSGPGALVEGFTARRNTTSSMRNPIPPDSGIEAINEVLIPHFLERAGSHRTVPNVDASRFEVDKSLAVFATERDALFAFQNALQIPFADLSDLDSTHDADAQDRQEAIRFWGFKVARGLLKSAKLVRTAPNIYAAFGGGIQESSAPAALQPETEWPDYLHVGALTEDSTPPHEAAVDTNVTVDRNNEYIAPAGLAAIREWMDANVREQQASVQAERENDYINMEDIDSSDYDSSGPSTDPLQPGRRIFTAPLEHMAKRSHVQRHTPCDAPLRSYRGHANTETVKDVNFFGLNDEYVVSGSDSGHFMIWDAATTELLNIVHGDRDVVNVVQGHPYEPLLAISGIESTVKIFGADARARRDAWNGRGVEYNPYPNTNIWAALTNHEANARAGVVNNNNDNGDNDGDDEDENEDAFDDDPMFAAAAWPEDEIDDAAMLPTPSSVGEDSLGTSDESSESSPADWTDPFAILATNLSSDESADDDEGPRRAHEVYRPRRASAYEPASEARGLRHGMRLRTRRRMQDAEQIVRRNEKTRRRGNREAFVTRGALAMLASRMRNATAAAATGQAGQAGAGGVGGAGLELPDGNVVPADDCVVQ